MSETAQPTVAALPKSSPPSKPPTPGAAKFPLSPLSLLSVLIPIWACFALLNVALTDYPHITTAPASSIPQNDTKPSSSPAANAYAPSLKAAMTTALSLSLNEFLEAHIAESNPFKISEPFKLSPTHDELVNAHFSDSEIPGTDETNKLAPNIDESPKAHAPDAREEFALTTTENNGGRPLSVTSALSRIGRKVKEVFAVGFHRAGVLVSRLGSFGRRSSQTSKMGSLALEEIEALKRQRIGAVTSTLTMSGISENGGVTTAPEELDDVKVAKLEDVLEKGSSEEREDQKAANTPGDLDSMNSPESEPDPSSPPFNNCLKRMETDTAFSNWLTPVPTDLRTEVVKGDESHEAPATALENPETTLPHAHQQIAAIYMLTTLSRVIESILHPTVVLLYITTLLHQNHHRRNPSPIPYPHPRTPLIDILLLHAHRHLLRAIATTPPRFLPSAYFHAVSTILLASAWTTELIYASLALDADVDVHTLSPPTFAQAIRSLRDAVRVARTQPERVVERVAEGVGRVVSAFLVDVLVHVPVFVGGRVAFYGGVVYAAGEKGWGVFGEVGAGWVGWRGVVGRLEAGREGMRKERGGGRDVIRKKRHEDVWEGEKREGRVRLGTVEEEEEDVKI